MSRKPDWSVPRACNSGCKEGYQSDRALGIIYPQFQMDDGALVSWEEGTRRGKECVYCRIDLSETKGTVPLYRKSEQINAR